MTTFLSAPGVPGAAGTSWVEVGRSVPGAHSSTTISFVNLSSGEVLPDPRRIGGRSYVDLNSPDLVRQACRPLMIRPSYDGNTYTYVPDNLSFIGRLGINSSTTQAGIIGVQHCGSTAIRRYRVGSDLASNGRIVVWSGPRGRLEGLVGPSGRRFEIRYPGSLTGGAPDGIAVNARSVYVEGSGDSAVWSAELPLALR